MNYRITPLNVFGFLWLLFFTVYTIINYRVLSIEEGWGMLAMAVILTFGGIALLVDLLLQIFIRRKKTLLIVEIILLIVSTPFIFSVIADIL